MKLAGFRAFPSLRNSLSVCAPILLWATPAPAQEISFEFINPSFGGNPFNSAHLIGVATAQRPEREGTDAAGLTSAQQFARQIQSRLLSALSLGVVEAITGADPGSSGEFVVGDQRISFERTLTEIRLTIFDDVTGETTEIVVPVLDFASAAASGQLSGIGATSAESSLLGSTVTGTGALESPLGDSGL